MWHICSNIRKTDSSGNYLFNGVFAFHKYYKLTKQQYLKFVIRPVFIMVKYEFGPINGFKIDFILHVY